MEIKSNSIVIEPIEKIVPDPKNENEHPEKQIEILCKIINVNGFREPLIVSNRSGYLVAGHGRLEAAKRLGMEKLPVVYQDFENEAAELRHRTASNEAARHASLNEEKLLLNLGELKIDLEKFDFETVGLEDFQLPKLEELGVPSKVEEKKENLICLKCGEEINPRDCEKV